MVKDRRYNTVKNLISGGHITRLNEIFDTLPKTTVALDLKIHNQKFSRLLENVERFELQHLLKLADLLEVSGKTVIDLAYAQFEADKKTKRKK